MIYPSPIWDLNKIQDENVLLQKLTRAAALDAEARQSIVSRATRLVEDIRSSAEPGLMEVFLAEYGLSTDEGVALMCLAEALLRVPDAQTIDALIEDKIAPSNWSRHLGKSSSPLVNASTWSLMLTGKILDEGQTGLAGTLRGMIKRLGEPVVRSAVGAAMRQMGRQFVLGESIEKAMKRAKNLEAKGYGYSYDMLGEAAMTQQDAGRYANAYSHAISALSAACENSEMALNPGISVKLSALHPRYEVAKTARVMKELVPIVKTLARQAAAAKMGFNIDAEEADRLGLSLQVIEAVLADEDLAGWEGFGVVVQAYGRRATDVIDGIYQMAKRYDRRVTLRLVKGAYWDSEIKHAQVEGLSDFPVFTRKAASDVSYIACAKQLLSLTDRIYPQFATHNAHSIATVLEMAKNLPKETFEFQRLHGMGEAVHAAVKSEEGTRCRIYAPVGAHRDLLAYLVRRLLENGANSSFVNQIVDENTPPAAVAACPFEALEKPRSAFEPVIKTGADLFAPNRTNSKGVDLSDVTQLESLDATRQRPTGLRVAPRLVQTVNGTELEDILDPTTGAVIGKVQLANAQDVESALCAAEPWNASAKQRRAVLEETSYLLESKSAECFSLLAAEAGKTLPDAVGELREAVDFLRFYAAKAEENTDLPRGIFTCISPWNFPLAIFTGQIAAALAAGNAVLAKPAETTPAIAAWAVDVMHEAGVPRTALQLLTGHGHSVGAALTGDERISGVAFTGSTQTAKRIQKNIAQKGKPGTPLIAETGGLNAMIIDSTALPEQAVRDVIASAFQSAGQRCSALRCLYVQDDILPQIKDMLIGAMNELELEDPWLLSTDVGPVISHDAQRQISDYIAAARDKGHVLHELSAPKTGFFVAPTLIHVEGIAQMQREIFGPVLHIASFKAGEIDAVVDEINATGYGLTFGLHSRIDTRVEELSQKIKAGNFYANRNQIGAVVESQPFGGEGLSGTGPKAGGPNYVQRFSVQPAPRTGATETSEAPVDVSALQAQLNEANLQQAPETETSLPGPTGELNRLSSFARAPILCLGPTIALANQQKQTIEALGGRAVVCEGLAPEHLASLENIGGALWWGDAQSARHYAEAMADRPGAIIPLICDMPDPAHARLERHLCVDTTAAGGNTALLSGS